MTVRGYLMGMSADPQAAPTSNIYRWATVTDNSPLAIQLDGDSLPLATVPDCLCDPLMLANGDRVWTQVYGRKVVVHGAQGGGTGPHVFPNEAAAWLLPSGSSSSNSAAWVDWPLANGGPLTATFIKRAASTRAVVDVSISGWVTSVPGVIDFGVRVTPAGSALVNRTKWNVANCHTEWNAKYAFTGLGAGSNSFILMMASPDGLTIQYDQNDTFSMTVLEVAP